MEKANKVILNAETLIDLTGDDTVESDVAAGKKFHRYDGVACVGTKEAPSGTVSITPTEAPDASTSIDVTNKKYVTVPGDAEDIINNLTFDEGDQMEYASENYFMRKVIIKKPDTLLPEYIKEGIAIAGISGELKEGITPSGTLEVTEAGTYDVTEYASIDVIVDDVPEWDGSYTISSLIEEEETVTLLAPTIASGSSGASLEITDNNADGVTVSYNIYSTSTGELVRTITRTASVQEEGMEDGGGVSYQVSAVDADGNESALSEAADSSCFVAGTPVLMADGSYKMIEEIVVGDIVQSYDIETGEYCDGIVTEVVTGYTTRIAMVGFADGSYVAMSEPHPLYTEGGWHSITNKDGYPTLAVGDKVLTSSGYVEITQIQVVDAESTMVYSLSVSVGDSTGIYFAGAGCSLAAPAHN